MFNMLNTRRNTGNNSPLVCKFLVGLTALCHSFQLLPLGLFICLKEWVLGEGNWRPVGLRIAPSTLEPVRIRFPKRKG